MPRYDSWGQVAGYFDGDGTIAFSDITNQPYKISVSLVFVDQSVDQINTVRDFLQRQGLRTSNVLKTSKGTAEMVAVSEFKSVVTALKEMLPFLCKKENEARATLEYYEGRTTGNNLVDVFAAEVEAGRRERRVRKVHLYVPYTRPDGDRIMKLIRHDRIRDALGRYRAKVTPEDYDSIRSGHFEQGKRLCDLAREYPQYARETIRRVLGGGRGYVLVRGRGRVVATNST
ncbi:MAG TPA: hypothetical protein VEJ36_00905 [Nitrososphaerales archaeon]|nr:hypothetical protein [Nitrososphaerales archaeon]